MPDDRLENRLFVRIFVGAVVLVALLAIGYWLFGPSLIRIYHEGGSFGIFPPDPNPHKGTLEEYGHRIGARFWSNIVIGIPLSLLFIFMLYKIYKKLFGAVAPGERADLVSTDTAIKYGPLWAAAIYSILTLIYFYPSLHTFLTAMIGPPEDNMLSYWVQKWAFDNVLNGHKSLVFITDIFYPEGRSSYYHAWSFYNLFLSFGLRQLLNPVATYNLLVFHTFPLAGIGAYLLTREVTRNDWLALLGGFLFAFSPAHYIRALHHLNMASIQFIPLFVYFFVRAIRGGTRLDLLWATLFFLLNALIDWTYLFYTVWFLLFAYLYLAIRRRRILLLDMIWKSAVVIGVTFLVISPWLIPMIRLALAHGGVGAPGHNQFVVDLAAMIVPNPDHLFGDFFTTIRSRYTGLIWEGTAYLGIPALIIVILACRSMTSVIAKYLMGAVSFGLMSLGAQPHFLGQFLPALVPGRVVPELPILANARCPGRIMVLAYLFWSVTVAAAVGVLWKNLTRVRFRLLFAIVAPLLLVIDYFSISRESTPVTLPACYAQLPRDQEHYGILDLPSGYERVNRYIMYQSQHGIPIVQGWFSRKIGSSLIDSLELFDLARQKLQLDAARVKYVILHKLYLPNDSVNVDEYLQMYQETYEDSSNIVLQVY